MRKNYVILAAVTGMTLASCTNQEYLGDVGTTIQETEQGTAITFGGYSGKMTRNDFTGGEAATKLGNEFKVYGVKSNRTTATNYDQVFPNFTVKYSTEQKDNVEYNNGWYYGGIGSQTIRYWDYSSANYHFVAGSPVDKFTFALKEDVTKDIEKATVTGLGGRLNHTTTVASTLAPVYIADPKIVEKANYKSEVEFTFRSMQSKVRVGIYETIPGYKITSITFYNNAATPSASKYITLNGTSGYFQGSSSATGTVTYNWATPNYTFAYTSSTINSDKCWEGGQFADGVKAVSSTGAVADLYGTDGSMATDGYFIVMPTPSATAAAPLTLKCDYILKSLDNVDEIHVTGATATIPADYTKWNLNTAYTYLFKISDNTNGSTGNPYDPDNPDPAGLYPITFDAVVVNYADAGQNVGTETTVSTPSITCYQNGNVYGNGIKFVAGADVSIKVTESSNIEIKRLSGAFDYAKSYDAQAYDGANATFSGVTEATLTNPAAKTYVIKATATTGGAVAYFVLVVGTPE